MYIVELIMSENWSNTIESVKNAMSVLELLRQLQIKSAVKTANRQKT